jgi:opacity protein-like surface antigen
LYIGGKLWLAKLDFEGYTESGTPIILAVGNRFSSAAPQLDIRAEFELTTEQKYSESECDEEDYAISCGKATAKVKWTAMANGFANLRINEIVSPYFGLGVGATAHEIKGDISASGTGYIANISNTLSDTTFTYQVMLGVAITPTHNFSIDLGYKYADYGKVSASDDYVEYEYKIKSSGVYFGANYIF